MHPIFEDIIKVVEQLPKVLSPDFIITGGGSTFLVTPLTKKGYDWIEEHVDPGVRYGQPCSYSFSRQAITGITEALSADGLKAQWEFR